MLLLNAGELQRRVPPPTRVWGCNNVVESQSLQSTAFLRDVQAGGFVICSFSRRVEC